MKISGRRKRAHDPWGNKHGNRYGSPIRFQFLVAKKDDSGRPVGVDTMIYYLDRVSAVEQSCHKYVRASKNIEKLRR